MQALAPIFSALTIIGDRWASRCPACPELRCPAIAVALTCGGPASMGAITSDSSGALPVFPLAVTSALFGAALCALFVYCRQRSLEQKPQPVQAPVSFFEEAGPSAPAEQALFLQPGVAASPRPVTPAAKRALALSHG